MSSCIGTQAGLRPLLPFFVILQKLGLKPLSHLIVGKQDQVVESSLSISHEIPRGYGDEQIAIFFHDFESADDYASLHNHISKGPQFSTITGTKRYFHDLLLSIFLISFSS
jgi:hypothetical protein